MVDEIFKGIFDQEYTNVIRIGEFLLCLGVSLAVGFLLSLGYMFRTRHTKSFVVTLALLPVVVCVVIMMVNGNVGTGVAVAGAFSLVRFRSVPGTAREIGALFVAMAAGLIAGMGYLAYSAVFTAVMCGGFVLYRVLDFGKGNPSNGEKILNVTVPEDLNYSAVFTDLLDAYTSFNELIKVKTTNMGSLYRLTYRITLRDPAKEKELIDHLRCRNGNLEISVFAQETEGMEL